MKTKIMVWRVPDVNAMEEDVVVGVPGSGKAVAEAEMVIVIDKYGSGRVLKSRYHPPEDVEVIVR